MILEALAGAREFKDLLDLAIAAFEAGHATAEQLDTIHAANAAKRQRVLGKLDALDARDAAAEGDAHG